jgi:peroxiredoxin
MKAFGKQSAGSENLRFLADTAGAFSAALDILFDATGALGNKRARRASMLIEDGKITWAFVEETGGFTRSDAGTFLREALKVSDVPATEFDPPKDE